MSRPIRPPLAAALLSAALASLLLLAGAVPAADGAVVATSFWGFEGGPAIAADGRIIVGERRGNGARRILAIDRRTGRATTLTSFPALADATTYPELNLAGSGGIVTATLDTFAQVGEDVSDHSQTIDAARVPLASRTMTILPRRATLASCGGPQPAGAPQLDAAGGTDFVATVGEDCAANAGAVRITAAGATRTFAVQAGPADYRFEPRISNLRASGAFVSWVETRLAAIGARITSTVVVARGSTGEVLLRAELEPAASAALGTGLGADGTVVLTAAVAPCVLGVVSQAAPQPRTLRLPGQQCAELVRNSRGQSTIGVAGGRVVYASIGGYAGTDLQGAGTHGLPGTLRLDDPLPVAFDGRTALVLRTDCDADRLLAIDARARGPQRPDFADPCPVRRAGSSRLRVAADGRVRLGLSCKAGCRGTLRLVQQRRGHRERLVGQVRYAGRGGRLSLRPRIATYARGLAGCGRGLRVAAIAHPVGDDHRHVQTGRGKGLGPYRIVSGAACRRGGPPFTAPRPGPRP